MSDIEKNNDFELNEHVDEETKTNKKKLETQRKNRKNRQKQKTRKTT